ncbi:hypothetical protein MMC06_000267 [Schaereria dolodes]|nr:hypothetical protein [Schaereria dolodes]
MASTEIVSAKHVLQINPIPPRRRIKASELPLNATQRSSIDSLLHTIKKKGAFDALRKKVWSQYVDSDAKTTFATSLIDLAESEIDRDPILLSKERNKAANLIEGAVDRSSLYRNVEASVDSLIAEHINNVESAAREIRRLEVDEDVAAEEERLGSKTDDEYAKECALRREAREKTRKQEESRRRREEEKVRLRAEEKKKMLELEKLRGAEKRRKGEELKEEKRKKEREARQEAEKKLEEERETERRERYEWRKREERERVCEREREREISRDLDLVRSRQRDFDKTPREGEENYRRSRSRPQENSSPPGAIPAVDEKALEQAALELLLKEGRELAAKSGQKLEIERSDSLEPPPRRSHVSKPKVSESTTPKLKDKSTSPPSYDPRSTKASVSGSNIPSGPREYGNMAAEAIVMSDRLSIVILYGTIIMVGLGLDLDLDLAPAIATHLVGTKRGVKLMQKPKKHGNVKLYVNARRRLKSGSGPQKRVEKVETSIGAGAAARARVGAGAKAEVKAEAEAEALPGPEMQDLKKRQIIVFIVRLIVIIALPIDGNTADLAAQHRRANTNDRDLPGQERLIEMHRRLHDQNHRL